MIVMECEKIDCNLPPQFEIKWAHYGEGNGLFCCENHLAVFVDYATIDAAVIVTRIRGVKNAPMASGATA